MRKGIVIIFCLVMIINNINAQQNLGPLSGFNEEEDNTGAFYFNLDFTHAIIDFEETNKMLQEAFYPRMDIPDVIVGFGFEMHIEQYIFSMMWNMGTKRVDEEVFRTETIYRDFNFMIFGWDLLKTYKKSLYPYIGLRGSGLQYTYFEKNDSNGNLKSYLNDDLDIKQFGISDFDLDVGIGFSINKTVLMKIRGGYLLSLQDSKWYIENYNKSLTSKPLIINNFYVTATIGLGGHI